MRHKLILGLMSVMILISCSEKITRCNEVIVHGTKMDYKELELKVNRKGQGWSLHNFYWNKYNVDESYWIYVPKMIAGRVIASEFQFSNQRNHIHPDKNDKGFIDLDSTTITINLERTFYKKNKMINQYKPFKWLPFEFNGRYKLRFPNDSTK